jgi:hypothetical protein
MRAVLGGPDGGAHGVMRPEFVSVSPFSCSPCVAWLIIQDSGETESSETRMVKNFFSRPSKAAQLRPLTYSIVIGNSGDHELIDEDPFRGLQPAPAAFSPPASARE